MGTTLCGQTIEVARLVHRQIAIIRVRAIGWGSGKAVENLKDPRTVNREYIAVVGAVVSAGGAEQGTGDVHDQALRWVAAIRVAKGVQHRLVPRNVDLEDGAAAGVAICPPK